MDKKIILPGILILALIIDLIIGRTLYNAYLNSGAISSQEGFAIYTNTSMTFSFILSSGFYLMILLFFKEHKLLSIYAALSLLVAFCFSGYVVLSNYYTFDTIIIRLYAGISYMIGFINIILATSIILKELHTKQVTVSLLYLATTQFVFGTLVVDYVRGYLIGFFGPYEEDLVGVLAAYDVFLVLIKISVVIVQVFVIRSLISVQKGHVRVFRRM